MIIDPKTIAAELCDIVARRDQEYRDKLSADIHVVDLSISAVRALDSTIDNDSYNKLVDKFKSTFKIYSSLEEMIAKVKSSKAKSWIGFTNDSAFGKYLAANNYEALQKGLNKIISSVESDIKTVELEYLSLKGTNSPTSQKVAEIVKRLPLVVAKPILQKFNSAYEQANIKVDYLFERADINAARLSSILGTSTVLVTIKTPGTIPDTLIDSVLEYVNSDKFTNSIVDAEGLKEDIQNAIYTKLGGKGAPKSKTKKAVATKSKKVQGKGTVSQYKLPALRNITSGRFTSIASLEFLLRHKLAPQIKLNMGQGNRKDILNYRTGRFARSASIERVTRSRDDFITVYYDYMKYPYATFSEGGVQQNPRSRDPKLLISKSIRQIASSVVSNRMRAVLV